MYNPVIDQLTDIEILTLTLFGEARGEPIAGLVAVGAVIRNRIHSGKYKSYKETCLAPKQFSCWLESDTNYTILIEIAQKLILGDPPIDPSYRRCLLVANGIIDWSLNDETKSAKDYLTTELFESVHRPTWARVPFNVVEIGNQTFFSV